MQDKKKLLIEDAKELIAAGSITKPEDVSKYYTGEEISLILEVFKFGEEGT